MSADILSPNTFPLANAPVAEDATLPGRETRTNVPYYSPLERTFNYLTGLVITLSLVLPSVKNSFSISTELQVGQGIGQFDPLSDNHHLVMTAPEVQNMSPLEEPLLLPNVGKGRGKTSGNGRHSYKGDGNRKQGPTSLPSPTPAPGTTPDTTIRVAGSEPGAIAPVYNPADSSTGTGGLPPTPETSGYATYTVQAGDILSRIAATYGISLAALEAANPQITNTDFIQIGDVINIPFSASSTAVAPAPGSTASPYPTMAPAPTLPSVIRAGGNPEAGDPDWFIKILSRFGIPLLIAIGVATRAGIVSALRGGLPKRKK